MHNDWITIGPITIHGYGFMIALGILAAFFLAERLAKRFKLDDSKIDNLIFLVVIFGFVGAKFLYILTDWQNFVKDPLAVLGSEGFVVYGGIGFGILSGMWYCQQKGWNFLTHFNVLAPCISLAQALGRLGCWFAGCCYGIETDAWYGVQFPAGSLGPGPDVKVIPTELISSFGNFVIFGILLYNLLKSKHPERTGALYLILYGIGRFIIEFFRGDLIRGQIGILSTSQFISIFVVLIGFGLLAYVNRKKVTLG